MPSSVTLQARKLNSLDKMASREECIEKANWLVFKCGPVLLSLALVNSLWIGWSSYYSQLTLVMERNVSVADSEKHFTYTQSLETQPKNRNISEAGSERPFTYIQNLETQLKNRSMSVAGSSERPFSFSPTQLKDRNIKEMSVVGSERPFNYTQNLQMQPKDRNVQQVQNLSTTETPQHSNPSPAWGDECPTAMKHIPPLAEFTPLSKDDIKGVRTVVIFIGFARSGHSIVGSLMDAHPDIIVAHEYNILQQAKTLLNERRGPLGLFNALFKNSHGNALHGWRNNGRSEKGYTLSMKCTWQGRLRRLRVIGDKSAGKSVQQFMEDHSTCLQFVQNIQATAHAPVKAIRVLRNPYDIVATRLLYTASENRKHKLSNVSEFKKYQNAVSLERHIKRLFALTSHVESMITECHLPVLDVHLVDLVRQPRTTMRALCDYVAVECTDDYLEMCEGKVFKRLSKTRDLVEWPQELQQNVASRVRNFTAFQRYSFDCDC